MALLNINPILLMAKPAGAEFTFMLLMVAICVAGKLMPQMAKGPGEGIYIFDRHTNKK